MITAVLVVVFGLVLLVWSAERFVDGASSTASRLGMPPLLIGMVVVGFGTSAPEMVVSALAASQGYAGIALGNILGSNLFNTLAVVGIAGSISPMRVDAEVFSRDILVMGGLTFSLFVMGYGFRGPGRGRINRFESAVLPACYVGCVSVLVRSVFQA